MCSFVRTNYEPRQQCFLSQDKRETDSSLGCHVRNNRQRSADIIRMPGQLFRNSNTCCVMLKSWIIIAHSLLGSDLQNFRNVVYFVVAYQITVIYRYLFKYEIKFSVGMYIVMIICSSWFSSS